MINESKYCHRIIETEFNKPLILRLQKIIKILKNLLNVGFVKSHLAKVNSKKKIIVTLLENIEVLRIKCNLNLTLTEKHYIGLIICKIIIHILSFRNLEKIVSK